MYENLNAIFHLARNDVWSFWTFSFRRFGELGHGINEPSAVFSVKLYSLLRTMRNDIKYIYMYVTYFEKLMRRPEPKRRAHFLFLYNVFCGGILSKFIIFVCVCKYYNIMLYETSHTFYFIFFQTLWEYNDFRSCIKKYAEDVVIIDFLFFFFLPFNKFVKTYRHHLYNGVLFVGIQHRFDFNSLCVTLISPCTIVSKNV